MKSLTMKQLLAILIIFCAFKSFSQQEEFQIQGQIIDENNIPVSDVIVVNLRDNSQHISRQNGIFSIRLLPSDSIYISHVTFLDKIISAFDILSNPIIKLAPDTVSIGQINVYETTKTDYQRAMENIAKIEFDTRPQVTDNYSESERMEQLLQTHNKVERAAAHSLTYRFSPSAVIGKVIDKIKIRKKSNQYSSTKKNKKKQERK